MKFARANTPGKCLNSSNSPPLCRVGESPDLKRESAILWKSRQSHRKRPQKAKRYGFSNKGAWMWTGRSANAVAAVASRTERIAYSDIQKVFMAFLKFPFWSRAVA